VGLDRAELLERCGEPSMRIASKRDSKLLETYWYDTADHDVLEIKLIDRKIASVTLRSKKNQTAAR
jgi:hypothetical protein